MSGALIGKGNHRHFMEKEIFEQASVLGDTLRSFADPSTHRIGLPALPFDLADVPRLAAVACGTASYACLVGKYWFEQLAGLPVDWDIASEFRYRDAPLVEGQVGLFVSQSGETADTLAAMRHLQAAGHKALAVVNVPESTVAREADALLRTLAGPGDRCRLDQGFHHAAGDPGVPRRRRRPAPGGRLTPERESELTQALDELPARITQVLEKERRSASIAHELTSARDVLYVGRGTSFAVALEGALKLKEISYIHAEAYAAGELKHGPIALIDESVPVIVVAPARSPVREDRVESAGDRGARRTRRAPVRRPRRGRARRLCLEVGDPAHRRRVRGADSLRRAGPAAGLPHRRAQGHRRGPAAQPGEERHGRVASAASAALSTSRSLDRLGPVAAYHLCGKAPSTSNRLAERGALPPNRSASA